MNFGKLLMYQRKRAYEYNLDGILSLLDVDKKARLCDLGCNDGEWTMKLAGKIGTSSVYGVDLTEKRLVVAKKLGVNVFKSDLNNKLPFNSNNFDVIHANQVIEHLNNTDLFLSEIYRVLKPGGYAIISTENLASWHNVFALILGYMPFSLTNVTMKTADLGNPLAPHNGESFYELDTWQHQRVFTTRGLAHLFRLHGFKIEKIAGSGYYPLGNIFAKYDKNHCAFITFKIRK